MLREEPAPEVSVVVTVTTGGEHVLRCLEALAGQRDAPAFEVLVPLEAGHPDREAWRARFPAVRFPEAAGEAGGAGGDPGRAHLAYDRRRAAGLAAARGRLVAITEDHARPDPDWCAAIARAHARWPHPVIGGAIDNASPEPLTWAVYLSDFGRYQSPLAEGPAGYVSDVNVSYKREALEAVAATWRDSYHETAVHGALRAAGGTLWLTPSLRVRQQRGHLALGPALRERFAWARLYAGKRAHEIPALRRCAIALGTPLLPFLLLARQIRNARARKMDRRTFLRALPWLALLLCVWSAGELVGLVTGRPVAR